MSIKVIDLEKRHPGSVRAALSGLSLTVAPGQVAAILGRSGAGKTTLLRCLTGLDPFDGGTVEIDGVQVKPVPSTSRRASSGLLGRVGLVFQSFELFPHLSVLENCTLAPIQVKRVRKAEAEARARQLLTEVGLAEHIDAHPESMSGGQRQRVALARALAMDPRVLLYDEPTSALDPSLKHEVAKTVRRVAESGIAQILVTHDVPVARAAADVVFVLDAGRIVEFGPPEQVLERPQHAATVALLNHG